MNLNEMIKKQHIGFILPKNNQSTHSLLKDEGVEAQGVLAWSGWVLVYSDKKFELLEQDKSFSILPTLA